MTDPLDELLELRPTHASELLTDPVELAVRAGRSARHARRRDNALTGVLGVAAVTVVGVLGLMSLRPTQDVPAASPTPEFPHPSSTPMSSFAPMHAAGTRHQRLLQQPDALTRPCEHSADHVRENTEGLHNDGLRNRVEVARCG